MPQVQVGGDTGERGVHDRGIIIIIIIIVIVIGIVIVIVNIHIILITYRTMMRRRDAGWGTRSLLDGDEEGAD